MEKNISAFFTSSENARSAAFALAESSYGDSEIIVESANSSEIGLSNYSLTGTVCGAVIGIIFGLGVSILPVSRIFSSIAPTVGLLAGSVIGAVGGSLIDILSYEENPECSELCMTVSDQNCGLISKSLKRHGAEKIIIANA